MKKLLRHSSGSVLLDYTHTHTHTHPYSYDDIMILILASDDLWERFTNEEAQECVKDSLLKHEKLD